MPQQNGVTERMNITSVKKARTVIYESGIGKELWIEVVLAATYVTSRSHQQKCFFAQKPNVKKLRVFGCVAYAHVNKEK
jgi:hypothetical protein